METKDLKYKEYTNLNNHYLKIILTKECLSLIGFNTEILDNILYQFSITPEDIMNNNKIKNISLAQLYDKIIDLIEKKKYLISGNKNTIVLSIFEGESFDINKDLQFFLIKSIDDQSGTYEKAMKKLIMSLKKENMDIKNQLQVLQTDKKSKSEELAKDQRDLSKTTLITKTNKNIISYKTITPQNKPNLNDEAGNTKDSSSNNKDGIKRSVKRKNTFGLNISTLANLNYDSYPMVELSPSKLNIISAYAGNSYNGLKRKYNEDRFKIITEYKLPKPVKKKNGEMIDPQIFYFAIYDGHGGEKCCNFLQENLHNYIFSSNYFPLYTMQAINKAYIQAEQDFSEKVIDPDTGRLSDRSGSCAVSALIMDEFCFITNLGDSRALYSYDSGNQLFQITRDHKPNDPIEKERIEKAGGKIFKESFVRINGQFVKIDEAKLPPGFSIPYRIIPGNIAVRKKFIKLFINYINFIFIF